MSSQSRGVSHLEEVLPPNALHEAMENFIDQYHVSIVIVQDQVRSLKVFLPSLINWIIEDHLHRDLNNFINLKGLISNPLSTLLGGKTPSPSVELLSSIRRNAVARGLAHS